ncbi:carboxypeptidase-like regulatory domain-containing protein [Azoarcus sp. PA01]|nr:carboxypeptidase-like regulatory domain-containing protein [Azoarcus sp. PA01]
MNRHNIAAGLLVLASGLWGGTALAQEAAPTLDVREFAGVRYMTGGVGEEERNQLLASAQDFNLKLVFAEKSGNYLADVNVAIADSTGRKVLEASADGPLMLAQLPPGNYRVTAMANGREQTRNASVTRTGQRSLTFYW